MSNAKTVDIPSNTTVSKTVKSLKSSEEYYVQIRSYKTVDDETYYSGWSKAKTVVTK